MNYLKVTIVITLITAIFICLIHAPNPEHVIATVNMDRLGHYRLTNYSIDNDKCLHFTDFVGEKVTFCGAYSIVTREQYHAKYEHLFEF